MKRLLMPLVLALSVTLAFAMAQQTAPERYALIVGVNEYDHDNLTRLNYAVNDADVLARVLEARGYRVSKLTDRTENKPTRANIEAALKEILAKFKAGDTILIACSGHGLQFGEETYFCPRDAKPFDTQTATLLSLSRFYTCLEQSHRGAKLILLDACRNNGERGRRHFDRKALPTPRGQIGVLLGCAEGQEANEHDDLKHGVFFEAVIRGLEGNDAIDPVTGEVTWDSLRTFVKREVPKSIKRLYTDKGDSRTQTPNEINNLVDIPVLVPKTALGRVPERLANPVEKEAVTTKEGELTVVQLASGADRLLGGVFTQNGTPLDVEFLNNTTAKVLAETETRYRLEWQVGKQTKDGWFRKSDVRLVPQK